MRIWCLWAAVGGLLGALASHAQVSVRVPAYGVSIDSSANPRDSAEVLGSDVQIEGVAIINGKVFIDGERIPQGKTTYTSKKTHKTYRLHWGKDGNVSVEEK